MVTPCPPSIHAGSAASAEASAAAQAIADACNQCPGALSSALASKWEWGWGRGRGRGSQGLERRGRFASSAAVTGCQLLRRRCQFVAASAAAGISTPASAAAAPSAVTALLSPSPPASVGWQPYPPMPSACSRPVHRCRPGWRRRRPGRRRCLRLWRQPPRLLHPVVALPGRCEGGELRHLLWRLRPGFLHRQRHRRAQVSAHTHAAVWLIDAAVPAHLLGVAPVLAAPTLAASGCAAMRQRGQHGTASRAQLALLHNPHILFCTDGTCPHRATHTGPLQSNSTCRVRCPPDPSRLFCSACASDTLHARIRARHSPAQLKRGAPLRRECQFL